MPWWGILLITLGGVLLGGFLGYCLLLLQIGKSIGRSL